MKSFATSAILFLTLGLTTNASALDLSIDQINIGLASEYEKAKADNFPVTERTIQHGIEFYMKASVGKTKNSFTCTVGEGKTSKKVRASQLTAAYAQTLEGSYINCQYYLGFYEWKR